MTKIDQLLNRVARLAPAAAVLPPLLRALEEEETDLVKVVDLINLDPVSTAKLLGICNSAYVGSSNRVTSVFEAVQQLGCKTVYRMVAATTGARLFSGETGPGTFWRPAVLTAFAAQFIAQDIGEELGTMFTAGLLQDLGKQILAGEFKHDYFRLLESGSDESTLIEQEMSRFGMNHAEIGSRLLERWNFGPEIIASVGFHHDPMKTQDAGLRRLAAVLNLGNDLARSVESASENRVHVSASEPLIAMEILNRSAQDISLYRELLVENIKYVEAMCRLN